MVVVPFKVKFVCAGGVCKDGGTVNPGATDTLPLMSTEMVDLLWANAGRQIRAKRKASFFIGLQNFQVSSGRKNTDYSRFEPTCRKVWKKHHNCSKQEFG